ncbi:MAG TPA: hypothetical protein VGJ05_15630 [Fimbriiglobus sp.]|jgi:hypothetical protein
MRGLGLRILKSAGPAALVLAGLGYLLAEMAGTWFEVNNSTRTRGAETVSATLRQTLPFTMAAWGFGLTAGYEVIRSLWMPKSKPKPVAADPSVEDALQQLLREADARSLAETPRPVEGVSMPVVERETISHP